MKSKLEQLREKLTSIFDAEPDALQIFSVQLTNKYPAITAVRYFLHVGSSSFEDPVKLNGRVLMYREVVIKVIRILLYILCIRTFL